MVYASPDGANSFLMTALKSAKYSLYVYTYQITDDASVAGSECGELISLHQAGLDVVVLVSNQIYDEYDSKNAAKCYAQLVKAGINVTKAPSYYTYSHNKFAIIDDATVLLSTGNWSPSDFPPTASVCVAPLAIAVTVILFKSIVCVIVLQVSCPRQLWLADCKQRLQFSSHRLCNGQCIQRRASKRYGQRQAMAINVPCA
jgi:hypothetical protein